MAPHVEAVGSWWMPAAENGRHPGGEDEEKKTENGKGAARTGGERRECLSRGGITCWVADGHPGEPNRVVLAPTIRTKKGRKGQLPSKDPPRSGEVGKMDLELNRPNPVARKWETVL